MARGRLTALAPERLALLRWVARLGAVTAPALAVHENCSQAAARARLQALVRERLAARARPVADAPSLFTATRAGLAAAGMADVKPTRVGPASARHQVACAQVAVALERLYPDHLLSGERELRRDEHTLGRPLASIQLAGTAMGGRRHRPDLVMWPGASARRLPVAVEVELTAKAPSRLLAICRAWARCGCVSGVLYVTGAPAYNGVARAVGDARAAGRIALICEQALVERAQAVGRPESPVAGHA